MDESTTALLGDAYDGGVAGSGSVQVVAIKGETPPRMRGKTTLGILIVIGFLATFAVLLTLAS